jgi:hypothetical protein
MGNKLHFYLVQSNNCSCLGDIFEIFVELPIRSNFLF